MKKVKVLFLMAILASLSGLANAATLGDSFKEIDAMANSNPELIARVEKMSVGTGLSIGDFFNQANLCNRWLKKQPLLQMQGLTTDDCFNGRAPWFKMQAGLFQNGKDIDLSTMIPTDLVYFDPYRVDKGNLVVSFMGKIVQRINKNSYILMGTNLSGKNVPFYLTNVPIGNYQVGEIYMGYVQKAAPYKYKAVDGSIQIVNAGNKIYSMTEFTTMEKMIRLGL